MAYISHLRFSSSIIDIYCRYSIFYMGKQQKYNKQMRGVWKREIHNQLKTEWEEGFQQYYYFREYLRTKYDDVLSDWDDVNDYEEVDQVQDMTKFPIIKEMYYGWGYTIEDAVGEYLTALDDILGGREKEYRVGENTSTIKQTLKETVSEILKESKIEKFISKILEDPIFHQNEIRGKLKLKLFTSMEVISSHIDPLLERKYGITKKSHKDIYDKVVNTWLSNVYNVPIIGSRIKLVKMDDPYTTLNPGDEGIVHGYNDSPWGIQLMMKWDNGSTLDIVPDEDEYEVLSLP